MDDLDTFCKWFNNPELRKFLLQPYPTTKLQEKELLEKIIKDKDSVVLSIIVKKNKKLIGTVGLHKINKIYRSAIFGIVIGDFENLSRGYGTEAMEIIIEYGFNVLNLHRIDLMAHDFNRRAIDAYKKVGFIEEGRKRESFYLDGKYHDTILMAILKTDWLKNKHD